MTTPTNMSSTGDDFHRLTSPVLIIIAVGLLPPSIDDLIRALRLGFA